MKRLLFLILALLVTSSVWAASKVQVMTDGKIDVDRLPTISFFQDSDPASPELGQLWWNNSTAQLKVAGALGVYAFNATSLVEWDTTPAAFSFTDITNATTNSTYTSDAITVSGINWPAAISVSGDASAKYSVNFGTATTSAGTVESGDTVRAVVTSSADTGTAVNATVTIGGVSDAYSVTTAAGVIETTCASDPVHGCTSSDGSDEFWLVAQAVYNTSAVQLCRVNATFRTYSASGTSVPIRCEVWSGPNRTGSQYGESATATLNGGTSAYQELTFSWAEGGPNPTGNYYVTFIRETGTAVPRVAKNSSTSCDGNSSYNGYSGTSPMSYDYTMKVYIME